MQKNSCIALAGVIMVLALLAWWRFQREIRVDRGGG